MTPGALRLRFADSELAALEPAPDGRWCLRFAAAAAERDAGGGRTEAGWLPGLRLWLRPAAAVPAPPPLFGRLRAGRVLLDDGRWVSALGLPLTDGPARAIELEMAQGAEWRLPLAGLAVEIDRGFEDSLAC